MTAPTRRTTAGGGRMHDKQHRPQPQKDASTADGGGIAAAVRPKRECPEAGGREGGGGVTQ